MNETSVSQLVKEYGTAYGKAILKDKFPNVVDGLKRVHIRILWQARDMKEKAPSAFLMAEAGKIHPHGDSSIYDAIVRMSQEFCYNPALLLFIGDVGSYGGSNAASSRYTHISVSEFTKDIFFKGIEFNALEKQITEDLNGFEPVTFVPAIPTALIYANYTIGFGFSSNTVSLNFRNVCDLTCLYIKHIKANPTKPFDYLPYLDKFIPDLPIKNTITNYPELIQAYKQGNFRAKIALDGDVDISADAINIRVLPWGNPFKDAFMKLHLAITDPELKDKDPWFDKSINIKDLDTDLAAGDLYIQLKRGVNAFEAWEKIRKTISFSGTIHPIPNYTTADGFIREVNPINIIREWYAKRYNIILASKKHILTRLTQDIRIKEAHLIVCDHTDEVIKIIRNNNESDVITALCARFPLTVNQATHLSRVPIIMLSKTSRMDLERQYANLTARRDELRLSFTNIPDEIIDEINAIKKKYGIARTTKVPNYIGYISIDGGCLQFESKKEVNEIIAKFPKASFTIFLYEGPNKVRVTNNGKLNDVYSKITSGQLYGFKQDPDTLFTVYLNEGSGCCVKGFIPDKENQNLIYTTKKTKAIYKDGQVKSVNITEELSYRKTICSGGMTKIVYAYPDTIETTYIAIFCSAVPNVVTLYRITPETIKVGVNPTGTLHVAHNNNQSDWYINVPQDVLQRQTLNVLRVIDIEALLDGKSQIRIDLAQTKIKSSKNLEFL